MKYDSIELINENNGHHVLFESFVRDTGFLLQDFDPGVAPATFKTGKGYGQDGLTKYAAPLDPRNPNFTASIIGDSLAEIETLKQELDFVMNPKDTLTLKVNYETHGTHPESKIIHGSPDQSVDYSTNYKTSNDFLQEFKGGLECFDPYYTDPVDNRIALTSWEGGLSFPFTPPFTLAHRGAPTVQVFNKGHVPAPVLIIFKGPAVYPKVENLTTGQYVAVQKPLLEDETLYINTAYGQKSIEIEKNGVRSNGYNYIDLNSYLALTLAVGDNVLKYSSGRQDLTNAVEVRFRRRFLGI